MTTGLRISYRGLLPVILMSLLSVGLTLSIACGSSEDSESPTMPPVAPGSIVATVYKSPT